MEISKQALIETAAKLIARYYFLRTANDAYAALKKDTKVWQEEIEERALWKMTLSDGLEHEESEAGLR